MPDFYCRLSGRRRRRHRSLFHEKAVCFLSLAEPLKYFLLSPALLRSSPTCARACVLTFTKKITFTLVFLLTWRDIVCVLRSCVHERLCEFACVTGVTWFSV